MLFRGYDAMDTLDGTCSTRRKWEEEKRQNEGTKSNYPRNWDQTRIQCCPTSRHQNVFILVYHSSRRSDKQPILPWLHPAKTCKSPKYESTTELVDQPRNSDGLLLAVGFARVHSLAGLFDRSQDGIIGHGRFGEDVGGLGVQLDVERLDTYLYIFPHQYTGIFFLTYFILETWWCRNDKSNGLEYHCGGGVCFISDKRELC